LSTAITIFKDLGKDGSSIHGDVESISNTGKAAVPIPGIDGRQQKAEADTGMGRKTGQSERGFCFRHTGISQEIATKNIGTSSQASIALNSFCCCDSGKLGWHAAVEVCTSYGIPLEEESIGMPWEVVNRGVRPLPSWWAILGGRRLRRTPLTQIIDLQITLNCYRRSPLATLVDNQTFCVTRDGNYGLFI